MTVAVNRCLFEVYETDEENYIPYTPVGGEAVDTEKTTNDSEEESEEEDAGMEGDTDKINLHMGEIKKKFFYTNIISADYNSDYSDISCSGNIQLPFVETNLKEVYLGVRCRLTNELVEDTSNFDIKGMQEVFLGFITDESFTSEQTKLGLSGMTKCLEKEYHFDFSQMPISEIISEVIKTAGLEPVVDFTGLEDQVIDFSSGSSDSESSDDGGDTSNVAVSTDVKTLAKKICKGKKKPMDKAIAIFQWLHNNLNYEFYYNSRKSVAQVLSSGGANCVDHAKTFYALGSAVGLKVGYINTTCNGYGHVYNGIVIGGTVYTADASIKSVGSFNKTWKACPKVTNANIRFDWSMWGN